MSQQRPPSAPSLVHTQTFLLWPQKQASWFPSQLLPCPQEIRGTYELIQYHKAINYILSLCNHTKPPRVSFRVCEQITFLQTSFSGFPSTTQVSTPPSPGPEARGTHVNRCFYCLSPSSLSHSPLTTKGFHLLPFLSGMLSSTTYSPYSI